MIDPIAFKIFGLSVHWYGIIICAGMILGVAVAIWQAKKRGYKADMIYDFFILALPLAVIGARLYYVVYEWQRYAANPISALYIWEGGLAIYGGVIGGVIAAIIFCKWKKVPFGDLVDSCAPSLILGQAIGRWGNFVNQEAYGNAITDSMGNIITDPNAGLFPYGVYIENLREWHQATFFYESMWNLCVFALLLIYAKHAKHRGNVLAMYFVAYGIGRFFIEGLRTDSLYIGGLRVSQVLSAVLVIGGIIYIAVMHRKERKTINYDGKYSVKEQKAE